MVTDADAATADRLARRMGGRYVPNVDPVIAWTERFGTAVVLADAGARLRHVAKLKAILADKPDAGLPTEWWTLVDRVAAWIEQVEATELPQLGVARELLAALDAPPQPRHAWQDRER